MLQLTKNIHFFVADPCDTTEHINDWQRSVAFATDTTQICDNILAEGWYRVISGAGELMPTECPVGGLRCNTAKPIYLYTGEKIVKKKDNFEKIET